MILFHANIAVSAIYASLLIFSTFGEPIVIKYVLYFLRTPKHHLFIPSANIHLNQLVAAPGIYQIAFIYLTAEVILNQ